MMPASARSLPLVGTVLAGQYHVETPLARGGMSTLFRGTQLSLDRAVAIKVLDPTGLPAEPARTLATRFRREAAVLARINHPNVVGVLDFGEIAGPRPRFFLVLELLEGETLAGRLRRVGTVPARPLARLLRDLATGLREAHRHGVVHRDLKPANVMLVVDASGERAKIVDFGISKLVGEATLTASGMRVGSPRFMAPEQLLGLAVDARTDLYALGTIAFVALTGQHPFARDDVPALARAVLDAPLPTVRSADAFILRLAAIVRWCLQRDPRDRPADATALLDALATLDRHVASPLWTTCLVSGAVALAVAAATALGVRLAEEFPVRGERTRAVPHLRK